MEWKHPSIIALKGFPFTGKTTLSAEFAYHLRLCLLLSLDDILETITAGITSRPPPKEAEKLIRQAFEMICGQAEEQVSIGQSVIIDYLPLSRPHLDRLAGISKLVVVECRIDRHYAWEMRFKNEYPDSYATAKLPWYKARSWNEVLGAVKSYDKRLDEPIPGVSRLYLNVDQRIQGRHVIEACQTLVFCPEDRHIDFQIWDNYRRNKDDHNHNHNHNHDCADSSVDSEVCFCESEHRIGELTEKVLYEVDCLVCDKPITVPAYTCGLCPAAVHKSCAELPGITYTPQDFPTVIKQKEQSNYYSFPDNFPCIHCTESGNQFSGNCTGCIFKSLLKSRFYPTVFEHDGHSHRLRLWSVLISLLGEYTCVACREMGAYVGYKCDCCRANFHLECALLPYPVRDHKHGGHQHTLELVFTREDKEFDDFPCSHCLNNMSPEDWYYYCDLCDQTYHLKCAFLDDDE